MIIMAVAAIPVGLALALTIGASAAAGPSRPQASPLSSANASQELDRDTYRKRVAPDLAIGQVATPTVIRTGSTITFTVRVVNKRPASAPKVVVTDVLPSSTTFVSCTSTAGACEGTGNNRNVTFASLPGGASVTIVFVATLKADIASGSLVTNTAMVSFEGTDPDTSDNVATATITVRAPD